MTKKKSNKKVSEPKLKKQAVKTVEPQVEEEVYIDFVYTPPPPPEFRLYYSEDGRVISYTTENLEGQYIVVDPQTFAEARPDVKVVNGKVVRAIDSVVISKLKPSEKGTATAEEDISIIPTNPKEKSTKKWKLNLNELK